MGYSVDTYRRLAVVGLQLEIVRGVLAAVLLMLSLLGGLSFWAALFLAILAYAGLRLMATTLAKPAEQPARRAPRSARDAYAMCLELEPTIDLLARSVADPAAAEQLRQILGRIGQSLEVIVEDGDYDSSPLLLDLMRTTADLLYPFAKVARRGLDDVDLREGFRRDLGILEAAFDLLWQRLNRDAIVKLTTASEMIDFNLNDATRSGQDGGAS